MDIPQNIYGKVVLFFAKMTRGISTLLAICWTMQCCAQLPQTNAAPDLKPPPAQGLAQQPVPILDLEKQLIDFQNSLYKAAQDHEAAIRLQESDFQNNLENCYRIVTIILAVVLGIFAFFNIKSNRDVKRTVKQRIIEASERELELAMTDVKDEAEKLKTTAYAAIKKINIHIKDVEGRVSNLKEQFKIDNRSIILLSSILARAHAILNRHESKDQKEIAEDQQERRDVICLLKDIQKWAPTNRVIVVIIGRLYKQLDDLDSAIKELHEVIVLRIDSEETTDPIDDSDLLFNKACYMNLRASKQATPDLVEKHRKLAWSTLEKSIKIHSDNLRFAKADSDFHDLICPGLRHWDDLVFSQKNEQKNDTTQ